MSGTRAGGLRASETTKELHGDDFYKKVGALGGKKSRGGFGTQTVGRDGLTGSERARIAGAKGGAISRRRAKKA